MLREKKGVTSEGKGATPQEESESDSTVKLMMATFMAIIQEISQQIDTRFDENLSVDDKHLE